MRPPPPYRPSLVHFQPPPRAPPPKKIYKLLYFRDARVTEVCSTLPLVNRGGHQMFQSWISRENHVWKKIAGEIVLRQRTDDTTFTVGFFIINFPFLSDGQECISRTSGNHNAFYYSKIEIFWEGKRQTAVYLNPPTNVCCMLQYVRQCVPAEL